MKLVIRVIFGVVAFSLFSLMAFAQSEEILSYHSQIKVEPSSTLVVKETIEVRANNDQIKHGIYRDFPTIYYDDKGRKVKTGFDVISVRRDGQNEPWQKKAQSNGERLYIGSPQSYVSPGVHRYEIEFKTDNQLGYFADHDELYFNAIGTGWVFPIRKASAEIELPEGINQSQITTYGYTGVQGSKEGAYRASVLDGRRVYFETTRELRPHEGFTVVVGWPKGVVTKPVENPIIKFAQESADALTANVVDLRHFGYTVGGLISLVILIYYFVCWYGVGRDPAKGTIIPLYNAPKGLEPAAVRYISRMKYDSICLSATIIKLATKSHLRISEEDIKIGGVVVKTQTLNKTDVADGELSADEEHMMQILFAAEESVRIDQTNHSLFEKLENSLSSTLERAYKDELFHLNQKYGRFPVVLLFLTLIACGLIIAYTPELVFFALGIVAVLIPFFFIAALIFDYLKKAPTLKGREILNQIEGYKMYLETAESQDIAAANAQNITAELYEEHLPYAIALGVDSEWTEKFEASLNRVGQDMSTYHPRWYAGNRSWHDSKGFMSAVGAGVTSAIAAASTPPGSSSGGGGGGSSGGGGGGGGGGGW